MNAKLQHHSLTKEMFMGFCLGTANIIPGVSGGTFLLIFNIYERVFTILNQINGSMILRFGNNVWDVAKNLGTKGSAKGFMEFLRERDLLFLVKLILGAMTAILALSSLMKYLLVHHFSYTYSFFFGLILVSIIIPVKLIESWKGYVTFFILLGMVATVSVSWSVNPYDKVKIKSDQLEKVYLGLSGQGKAEALSRSKEGAGNSRDPGLFALTGKYTLQEYAYAGLCGAVSVCAMILPGISGSLVLILMGAYFDVISALSVLGQGHLDTFAFLGCFGVGILGGGLLFARMISFVLKRYYNGTMAFLLGLMAGSLHALWPFKKVVVMAQQYVKQDGAIIILENAQTYTNIMVLPANLHQLTLAFVFFLTGCAVMVVFIRVESYQAPPENVL